MKKTTTLLFFLFSVALLSAQFIDYQEDDAMGPMYGCGQGSTVYYVDQPVRYYLETDLYLPDGEEYRFLGGSGSPEDLHSGDAVCEGDFHYGMHVHADARNSGFEAWVPSVSGMQPDPDDWTDCGPADNCPEGDAPVSWSNAIYDGYSSAVDCYGVYGPNMPSASYARRSMHYRETGVGPFDNDEVTDVAVVMKGTTRLRQGSTTLAGPYTLMGTEYNGPISLGTPTFTLNTPSYTLFSFTQRINVDGGLVATDNVNANDWEDYWAFTETGGLGSQEEYDPTITSSASTLNVYADENVGVLDPELKYVDLWDDGIYLIPPEQVPAGSNVPVRIVMEVPQSYLGFWPLEFEFYSPTAVLSGGSISSQNLQFTVTEGINQCPNGLVNSFFGDSDVDIVGTVEIPEDLPEGTYTLEFGVSWRTCSGEEDCDGSGQTGIPTPIEIEIEIPHEGPDPDLICEVEPITYVDGIAPGPDGFEPGQGVEDWRVTVTNIGDGNASIPDFETAFCSVMLFQALSSDGTQAFDPAHGETLTTSYPDMLVSGQSVSFEIEDGTAICVEGEGENVLGYASVNRLELVDPVCSPYTILETDYSNNWCYWTAPCTEASGPDECTIIPPNVPNPPSASIHDFELFCDGDTCTGPVAWTEEDQGDDIADMTDSDSLGATAQVTSYEEEDELSGTTILTATVGYPDNMICNATITLNQEPPENGEDEYCYCEPTPQTGYPGSVHEFDVWCVEEGEDPEHCGASWTITEGSEFVSDTDGGSGTYWYDVYISESLAISEEAGVEIRAKPDGIPPCYCEINLPPMDCLDFI
ncbi:hypothetical protein GF412_03370 [Candidatus Micrarchaeota archaeon]|nr:hypothetical protein [Candidatus Micrarchaeota archaeon]MBD3417992.1 hypothetical protein [Candidatus Micrarchaeota archaeon]